MIKKVLIDDNTEFDGWVIGEHAVRNTVYRKRVYWFGFKTLDHTYTLKETYDDKKDDKNKSIGFSKTNK